MKNKKNIYILLPAVILVWGLLAYKIFFAVKSTNDVVEQLTVSKFKPKVVEETATFTISANYRDPFLGTMEQKEVPKKRATGVTKKKSVTPFPTIRYNGVISSQDKKQVFLITINGEQFFFSKRATHKEVKLLKGSKKEVVLQFKGQLRTVAIAK